MQASLRGCAPAACPGRRGPGRRPPSIRSWRTPSVTSWSTRHRLARMGDSLIRVERDESIAVVLLNRPKQLNALSDELMDELVSSLRELDEDDAVLCIVL